MLKARNSSKAHTYQREHSAEFNVNPAGDLFCMLCITTVTTANCDKKFRIEKHRAMAKHEKKNANNIFSLQQQFLPSSKKQFKTKLVLAFMSADIPLFKLRNPQIVSLFADLGQAVPSETVCLYETMSINLLRPKQAAFNK